MHTTDNGSHQELTSSLKSGNESNSHGSGYGSAQGSDEIVVDKKSSRCTQQCFFKWAQVILSIAALVISIIILVEVSDVKSNNEDTMTLSQSNEQAIGHLSRNT